MRRFINAFLLLFVLMAAIAAIFLYDPSLDLQISSYFFNETGFYLEGNLLLWLIKKSVPTVLGLMMIWSVLYPVYRYYYHNDSSYKMHGIIVILFLVMVPFLLIHFFGKDMIGRARPNEIREFGGGSYYSAPLQVSRECYVDCSFPSGHSAFAFSIAVFALIFPNLRNRILAMSLVYGGIVGFSRVAVGHHFASDVIFSAVIVYCSLWMAYIYLECSNSSKVIP